MNKSTSRFLIPESLYTERLHLRCFQQNDWRDLHRYYSDAECTKYTLQRVLTERESWFTMAAMMGHWSLHGYGPYALEHRQSGRVLGVAGLWYPLDWPEPEIKWGLCREYWGKGYAAEAARAVKQMAAEYLPQLSLISLIFEGNSRSKNLAMALGASFERDIKFRGQIAHIFRHSRDKEKGNKNG